ncbi:MAG TPA: hypothetical protein VNY75_04280 [Rhizomicrobium sp.]|nr:hypothetical protein [Rhizomicrobium sp.]
MTLLALLAFFLQSLLVQSHFHSAPQPVGAQATAAHVPSAPLRSQGPVDQCRLCQELMHAGVFVTPSASFAVASLALTTAIFIVLPSALVSPATAFAWRSRAPPRR